jgi:hypothetical protein
MLTPMTRGARATSLLAAAILLAGCGSVGQPASYPEQGVDGLQVPTATIEPDAYVRVVDHPLLPLDDGRTWTYEVTVAARTAAHAQVIAERAGQVGGAPVTRVRTTLRVLPGGLARASADAASAGERLRAGTYTWVDAFAQDLEGNVWWLARDVERGEDGAEGGWTADSDGALAGLVMPATPRVGDAYEHRSAPGLGEAWSLVEDADVRLAGTPVGELDGLLQTSGTGWPSPLAVPGSTDAEARRWSAPGLGLVREESDGVRVDLVRTSD